MATASNSSYDWREIFDPFRLNERVVEAAKRAGRLYLDGYEKFVHGLTAVPEKAAEQTRSDVVKEAVQAQVEATRQLTAAYTAAARELIR